MTGKLTCFGSNGGDARVYYLGSTGNVHEAAWSSRDVVWSFTNLTGKIKDAVLAKPNGSLASFAANGTDARVHFLDASAHVCQIAFEGGNWAFHDLTHLAKPADASEPVVPAASGSKLACFGYQGKDTRVQFLDAKANVCQIGLESNQWLFRNLTDESGAPKAANNSALVSFADADSNARIYFLDDSGNVIEISWNGSKWGYANLTKAITYLTDSKQPTKPARSGSPLCGFAYDGKDTRVYFQDDDSHICEISYANNRWEFTNATAVAKPGPNQGPPPVPARDTDLTCLAISGRNAHVYYIDGDWFIWELAHADDWVASAVQLEANSDASWAPAAAPATPLACYLASGTFPKVYYFRWQDDINELTSQGQWVNRTIVATEAPSNPVSGITLKGNSNYSFISADSSKPNLTGVSVNLDITWPIALNTDGPPASGSSFVSGFSFQLNALSPSAKYSPGDQNELTAVQQYVIAMEGTTLSGVVNNWTAQRNSSGVFDKWTINTNGNPVNLHTFPSPNIPAGYRLTITLWNDSAGNVTSVSFVVMDTNGEYIANVTQQLSSIGGNAQAVAPIVTFLLVFVGPVNSEYAYLVTGEGMFSYNAAQPLIAVSSLPKGLTEVTGGTAESANTYYGELPTTGGTTGLKEKLLAQPFKVGSKPQ